MVLLCGIHFGTYIPCIPVYKSHDPWYTVYVYHNFSTYTNTLISTHLMEFDEVFINTLRNEKHRTFFEFLPCYCQNNNPKSSAAGGDDFPRNIEKRDLCDSEH